MSSVAKYMCVSCVCTEGGGWEVANDECGRRREKCQEMTGWLRERCVDKSHTQKARRGQDHRDRGPEEISEKGDRSPGDNPQH